MSRVCTCRCCRLRAHGRECLICDSCEDMYHVSCIEHIVEEIPLQSWYCCQCISNGKRSTHEECVICERLYASETALVGVSEEVTENNTKDLAHNGDDDVTRPFMNSFGVCSIGGSDMHEDEIIRECSHSFCPHRSYHERCLTKAKELKSYGLRGYCPSCLWRACLSDQDDDKIMLCDACYHAYHICCVKPLLSEITVGKWFCREYEAGLQASLIGLRGHARALR